MSDVSIDQMVGGGTKFILAPHFSAIVRGAVEVRYFILGQSPIGGGTTLRCILPDGNNCNLGPGPKPELAAFLHALGDRETQQAQPGADSDPTRL